MRIFIAGATGAIGSPLVQKLVKDGHAVFGMTRSHQISAMGAIPIIADVLNASSILEGVKKAEPEVVIDMLTSRELGFSPKTLEWMKFRYAETT